MKLTSNKKFEVKDTDVIFTLRNPTNEEINKYYASKLDISGKTVKDNSVQARCELFDLLLTNIENLEDDNGIVTTDRKNAIPLKWKGEAIFKAFDESEIDLKN